MFQNMRKLLPILILTIVVATSCVSKKKYMQAEDGRLTALVENDKLNKKLSETSDQLNDCQSNTSFLNSQLANLKRDNANMSESIQNFEKLLQSNLSQQDRLTAALKQKEEELDRREAIISELQSMIDEQNQKVKNLLTNVENALLGFNSDELTVTQKNGKVYVALSDKLLFESGSAKVDKRGEEALAKLAEVLNKQTDIDVYIEGHTDSKPINTAQFKDNWDLSVIRATSVVRILTKQYGVNPLQIQPSGRGEFMPVASNETAEGRSRNRRTEIIMAPKIDKLFDMLQK